MIVGVNLPWLFGAYGHDLAPNERRPGWPAAFTSFGAYRPLVEARAMGFEAVRVWLCEAGEGIVTRDGVIEAVHPELLASVRALQDGARVAGVRVLWTLLDGGSVAHDDDALTRAVLQDEVAGARFAERVVAPIAAALDPRVTVAMELVHAPEAASAGWPAVARFARMGRKAAKGVMVSVATEASHVGALCAEGSGLDAITVLVGDGALPTRASLGVGDEALIAVQCDGDAAAFVGQARDGYAAVFARDLEGALVDAKASGRPLTAMGQRVRAVLGG